MPTNASHGVSGEEYGTDAAKVLLLDPQQSFFSDTSHSINGNGAIAVNQIDLSTSRLDIIDVEKCATVMDTHRFSFSMFPPLEKTSRTLFSSIDATSSLESDESSIPGKQDDVSSCHHEDGDIEGSLNEERGIEPLRLLHNASPASDPGSLYESKIPKPDRNVEGSLKSSLKNVACLKYISKIPTTKGSVSSTAVSLDIFEKNSEDDESNNKIMHCNDGKENCALEESVGKEYLNLGLESTDTMSTIHLSDSRGEEGYQLISNMFYGDADILGLLPEEKHTCVQSIVADTNLDPCHEVIGEPCKADEEGQPHDNDVADTSKQQMSSRVNDVFQQADICAVLSDVDCDSVATSATTDDLVENEAPEQNTDRPVETCRPWDSTLIALGAVVVVGLGATAALGIARSKRH